MHKDFKQAITLIQSSQLQKLEQHKIAYNKTLVDVEISKLVRPSYNTRVIIDNRLPVLTNNLTQFGFLGGIFIHSQNFHVIDGWHRLEIWHDLGNQTIPCHFIDCNSVEELQLHLRLNQQVAAFDLSDFGLNFKGFDLLEYGFTEDELYSATQALSPYKNFEKRDAPEGFVKLQTLVSKVAYEKLKDRKAEFGVKSVAEVIEQLAYN